MLKPIRFINSLLENSLSLCLTSRILVGGVLSVLALAFIPNSAFATDYTTQIVETSDFKAGQFNSAIQLRNGCNTVVSDSGITALGARASIFGADENTSGCGYFQGRDGLTWHRSLGDYNDAQGYDWHGNLTSRADGDGLYDSMATPANSLESNDYLSKNFRTSVSEISTSGSFLTIGQTSFETISVATDTKYADHMIIHYWKVPDNVIWSALTPSTYFVDSSFWGSQIPNATQAFKDEFTKDLYENTTITYGYPTDLIPNDVANYLALSTGRHHVEDWEGYAFLIAYIPQYATTYNLEHLVFSVDTNTTQNSIDRTLGGFSNFVVGLGNNPDSLTYPRLSYFYLGLPYTKNNLYANEYLMQDLHSIRFDCISATCHDQAKITAENNKNKHRSSVASFDFGGNNGSSWFDVFKINAVFPFTSFFTSLTDSSCVDIPIISSWLYNTNSHVCTYWNNSIRSTLTPVFMSLAVMLLFGFIVSWLKGNSNNAFINNGSNSIGDNL